MSVSTINALRYLFVHSHIKSFLYDVFFNVYREYEDFKQVDILEKDINKDFLQKVLNAIQRE